MQNDKGYIKNGTLWNATRNSLDGFAELVKESAARREMAVIVACALVFGIMPGTHTLLLLVLSLILLAVEALNTAIETICDLVMPDLHPAIKKAKDFGSVAIFIVSSAMTLVFVLVVMEALKKFA
ncbi:MAG: diacylglycerol kinase [Brachymonas sp.]|nr:diacylglycerol kinase [Brachymonas sp.]